MPLNTGAARRLPVPTEGSSDVVVDAPDVAGEGAEGVLPRLEQRRREVAVPQGAVRLRRAARVFVDLARSRTGGGVGVRCRAVLGRRTNVQAVKADGHCYNAAECGGMRAFWRTCWNAGIASGLVDLGQSRHLGYFSTWMTLDVSVACAKRGTYGGRIRRPRSACVMNTSRRQGVNTATCIAIEYGIQLMLLRSVGVV